MDCQAHDIGNLEITHPSNGMQLARTANAMRYMTLGSEIADPVTKIPMSRTARGTGQNTAERDLLGLEDVTVPPAVCEPLPLPPPDLEAPVFAGFFLVGAGIP